MTPLTQIAWKATNEDRENIQLIIERKQLVDNKTDAIHFALDRTAKELTQNNAQ